MKTKQISVRLPADLAEKLRKATSKNSDPLAPTLTGVVIRGVELALKEVDNAKC